MNSGDIMAQISQCRFQIDELRSIIAEQQAILAHQQDTISSFLSQRGNLEDCLTRQKNVYDQVSSYADTCVLSDRYTKRMEPEMSPGRRTAIYNGIEDIILLMEQERDRTEQRIEQLQRQLTELEQRQMQLNSMSGQSRP